MFSEKLNKTRKQRGFTAQQMAEKLHVGIRNYRKYESGDAKPTLDGAAEIAKILDVPLDYLLGTGIYGTLSESPWIKEILEKIMDKQLDSMGTELRTGELDEASFGELASAFFAKVQVNEAGEEKHVTLYPWFPLEENPPEENVDSD